MIDIQTNKVPNWLWTAIVIIVLATVYLLIK